MEKEKYFHKKVALFTPNMVFIQKTSQELRKAALRVGQLSRCWDDKKKIATKLENSNFDKTQKL